MIELGLFFRPLSILKIHEGNFAPLKKKIIPQFFKVSTDSRTIAQGQVFISIKGEKFDGDDFLTEVASKCSLLIVQKNEKTDVAILELVKEFPGLCIIQVANTILYLQELASIHTAIWQNDYQGVLVGIAGSNGKTTTKEMTAHIVKHFLDHEMVSTLKNNNNHIGMPLTLLSIDPRVTKVAIVEYGSNHPGEMEVLCRVALPQIAITTNIGFTHMEFFQNLQEVTHEEAALYRHYAMSTHKHRRFFLLNKDDRELGILPKYPWMIQFSIAESSKSEVDYYYEIQAGHLKVFQSSDSDSDSNAPIFKVDNPFILGEHNFINLGNALVIAQMIQDEFSIHLGARDDLETAAGLFRPTANRSQWLDSKFGNKIFLDAYNANPSSMKVALKAFKDFCEQRGDSNLMECIVILADMKELGESEQQHHQELGTLVLNLGFHNVVYIGSMSDEFQKGLGRPCEHYLDSRSAKIFWPKWVKEHPYIFLKGSRSLQLESLVDLG